MLAAADELASSFAYPSPGRLSQLSRLSDRISIYHNRDDAVLQLSTTVNLGARRLGQEGPQHGTDETRFPPAIYRMIDCSGFDDYDVDFASSHQYYRRSPSVRNDIAGVL